MSIFRILFGFVVLAASGIVVADSPDPRAAAAAAYDAILAKVTPDQTTVVFGDMIVPVATLQLWRDKLDGNGQTAPPSASQNGINLWSGGNVYYAFNANVTAVHQKDFIDAAGEWMAFANVHFIARTTQTNYVMVNDGGSSQEGGDSAVGMIGGQQQIDIGSTSWNRSTLVHEIGHTLGLIHEHQRSDRDSFVTINFSNVPGGSTDGNFILIPTSTNNGAYDFLSIMHYARKTFAVNPAIDTITPLAAYTQYMDIMGNNPDRVLSRGDRDGMAAMYGAPTIAPTTIVTNTNDSGAGALRTAIYKAFDIATNTPGATPVITFNIPNTDPNFSGGVYTIRPSDRLPAPGPGTTIDGTTQTAFTGDTNVNGPEVVLNGALQVSPDTYGLGLRLSAANVTVKGLVINGFSTQGILITGTGATGNTLAGCYIGTDASGATASPNAFAGIEIDAGASGNTIGGTTAAARNLISGNTSQGVFIQNAGTNGNIVEGNWIGLNAAGTAALPNGFAGVEIYNGAQSNTIGGTVAGAGNVISGNTNQGVAIHVANGNTVQGNLVGTNPAGTAAIPNAYAGVEIFGGAQSNTIGGKVAGARNILSGNSSQGVAIDGTGTSNNVVFGNYAGLNAAGTVALGNAYGGVQIFGGATNNTVGGASAGSANVLSGNPASGVTVSGSGSTGNVIAGNYIGTNPAGTAAIPNAYAGVTLFGAATGNTVGGTTAGAGNLISGNTSQGIHISDSGTNNNVVMGNWIGLNNAGNGVVANGYAGVEIGNGAQDNVIGGTTSAARNVISGNQNQGVALDGTGTTGNIVLGNYVGTNPAGTVAFANGYPGIEIFSGAAANTIGGTSPGAGNVISGNGFRGATITGAGTNNNVFAGNLIGLNAAGTAALANAGPGIQIFGGAQSNTVGGTSGGRNFIAGNSGAGLTISGSPTTGNIVVGNSIGVSPSGTVIANANEGIALFADGSGGAQGNTIGGSTPGAANLISGNTAAGVAIYNTGTINNRISGNSITGNGGLGIDLGGDGVTLNDSRGHTGPNNWQNFPVLTSGVLGLGTAVNGSLNSTANTTFRIEFFANAAGDASGYGEGQNFIGAISVTTNGSGNATFAPVLQATVPASQKISATATDPAGNTSEFAQNVTVTTTDTDGDGIPDAWMIAKFGHPTGLASDKSRATDDADGDGMTNLQEFRAGTDPRGPTSVFRLATPVTSGADKLVSLPSNAGITYRIDYAADLVSANHWHTLADQIFGTGSVITITDPGASALTQRFYRAVVLP